MKIVFLFLSFLLISCAASNPESEDSERRAEATDSCLADPEQAKSWGDCNVKTTIYDRMDVIMACQTKHGSSVRDSIQFEIEVNAKGGVKKVGAVSNQNKNLALESCLKKEIAKMKFAAPPKGAKPVIQFPYRN
jgi:hypothetical protein